MSAAAAIATATTTCPITPAPTSTGRAGKRLAVYFGLNLEHFAFGEGLGAELAPGGPQPDVLNYAWRDYGNRVGAWRMLEMFDGWTCRRRCSQTARCTTTRPD